MWYLTANRSSLRCLAHTRRPRESAVHVRNTQNSSCGLQISPQRFPGRSVKSIESVNQRSCSRGPTTCRPGPCDVKKENSLQLYPIPCFLKTRTRHGSEARIGSSHTSGGALGLRFSRTASSRTVEAPSKASTNPCERASHGSAYTRTSRRPRRRARRRSGLLERPRLRDDGQTGLPSPFRASRDGLPFLLRRVPGEIPV